MIYECFFSEGMIKWNNLTYLIQNSIKVTSIMDGVVMIGIVLYGDRKEPAFLKFEKRIRQVLAERYHMISISQKDSALSSVCMEGKASSPELVVIALPNHVTLQKLILEKGVIICWKGQVPTIQKIEGNLVCIVSQDSEESCAATLKDYDIPVISCGMSQKATLTFSSRNEEQCMVSLQRNIQRLDGGITEAMEFAIPTGGQDDYTTLAICALALLLEKKDMVSSENYQG